MPRRKDLGLNNRRLHGEIQPGAGYTTPAAFEADHYRHTISADQA